MRRGTLRGIHDTADIKLPSHPSSLAAHWMHHPRQVAVAVAAAAAAAAVAVAVVLLIPKREWKNHSLRRLEMQDLGFALQHLCSPVCEAAAAAVGDS